ncbi:MAG: hypothetical protein KDA77_07725, partial [Planctomycetaceae bacterium]|nr:hypothetical protein [Planctomycetaceae bacterium]
MWEYQALFRVGLEGVAERVFKLLDESFKPEIFLVGILVDNLNNGDPVCVEAKEDFWIQSEAFNPTLQIASEICQNYPEKDRLFSDRNSLESHNKLLFLRSIRDAIIKIIDSQNNTPNLDSYFVSLPTKVEKYHVCSVLKLQKNIVDSYPALATSQVAIHKLLNAPVTISLIDATITKKKKKACGELNLPEPGKGLLYGLSTDQIVREAANEFVRGLAFRADSSCIS